MTGRELLKNIRDIVKSVGTGDFITREVLTPINRIEKKLDLH